MAPLMATLFADRAITPPAEPLPEPPLPDQILQIGMGFWAS